MLKIIAASAAYKAGISHVSFCGPFEISELGESIDNDTKDDVQTDGRDEDEERQMKYNK